MSIFSKKITQFFLVLVVGLLLIDSTEVICKYFCHCILDECISNYSSDSSGTSETHHTHNPFHSIIHKEQLNNNIHLDLYIDLIEKYTVVLNSFSLQLSNPFTTIPFLSDNPLYLINSSLVI